MNIENIKRMYSSVRDGVAKVMDEIEYRLNKLDPDFPECNLHRKSFYRE